MRPTVESIADFAESKVPAMEREMEEIGFPFYVYPPELRMRVPGACGIVSETFRQELKANGLAPELLIRDIIDGGHPNQHVIVVVEGEQARIVVDGSFTQLMDDYGPSWRRCLPGLEARERFPDERVLVFEDGQQADVALWLSTVSEFASGHTVPGAYEYYRSLWDLEAYREYEALGYVQEDATQLRQRW